MSTALLKYTTHMGDRWDIIAHKFYGNARLIDGLIAANPHLPICEQFESNRTVFVPVLDSKPASNQEDMPPWMR